MALGTLLISASGGAQHSPLSLRSRSQNSQDSSPDMWNEFNPFSRRRLSRAFSGNGKISLRTEKTKVQSSSASSPVRSPLQNPSPATRRPRAQSPPPAYTRDATEASGPSLGACPGYTRYQNGAHPAISRAEASTEEDKYAFLSKFDTVFLIDDSGSMAGRSWRETQQAISTIMPIIFSHDEDGPDFYFMNHKTDDSGSSDEPWKAGTGYRNVIRAQGTSSRGEQKTVEELFKIVRPQQATPTGQRLRFILRRYLKTYEAKIRETDDETCLKPLSIIVITDGAPSDEVGAVIKQAAQKLDQLEAPPYQVGIQFFQVGNEPGAAEALRILDDELKGDENPNLNNSGRRLNRPEPILRDIVDTVTFTGNEDNPILTGDSVLKIVLGSVVKRLDGLDGNLREAR